MIDLGAELAGFDDHQPPRGDDVLPTVGEIEFERPQDWQVVPLADLEREGFNTEPPAGFEFDDSMIHSWSITRGNSVCDHGTLQHACPECAELTTRGFFSSDQMRAMFADPSLTIKVKLWATGVNDGFEPTGTMSEDA